MNLLRYAGVFTLVLLAVQAALWGMARLGWDLPASGLTIVPYITASINEGRAYAVTHQTIPEKQAAWRFSILAMLVSLIPQGFFTAFALILNPDLRSAFSYAGGSDYLLPFVLLVAFMLVVGVVANRLFLSIGAKNGLKARIKR